MAPVPRHRLRIRSTSSPKAISRYLLRTVPIQLVRNLSPPSTLTQSSLTHEIGQMAQKGPGIYPMRSTMSLPGLQQTPHSSLPQTLIRDLCLRTKPLASEEGKSTQDYHFPALVNIAGNSILGSQSNLSKGRTKSSAHLHALTKMQSVGITLLNG